MNQNSQIIFVMSRADKKVLVREGTSMLAFGDRDIFASFIANNFDDIEETTLFRMDLSSLLKVDLRIITCNNSGDIDGDYRWCNPDKFNSTIANIGAAMYQIDFERFLNKKECYILKTDIASKQAIGYINADTLFKELSEFKLEFSFNIHLNRDYEISIINTDNKILQIKRNSFALEHSARCAIKTYGVKPVEEITFVRNGKKHLIFIVEPTGKLPDSLYHWNDLSASETDFINKYRKSN